MARCELCELERRTRWYYDGSMFAVIDCEKCNVKMIVCKRHTIQLNSEERERLDWLLSLFVHEGEYVDYQRRTIPNHWHAHVRPDPNHEYRKRCAEED